MTSEQFFSLLQGAWGTLVLSLLTFAIGGLAGLALAMARISPARPVRVAAAAWIQLIQGTPLLVLMGLCFYGPNIAGIGSVPIVLIFIFFQNTFTPGIALGAVKG